MKLRTRIALLLATAALLGTGAAPAAAAAPPADATAAPTAGAAAHDPLGPPKNTKRCRKLLRKIDRADRRGKRKRFNRLVRRYNNTCRKPA